jgi:malonyl-CoA O-methyltransferase
MADKRQIASAFDGAAFHYDEIAYFQQRVGMALAQQFLPSRLHAAIPTVTTAATAATSASEAFTILDGGCGTGYHHRLLRTYHPGAHIVGIDLSATMLQRAISRHHAGSGMRDLSDRGNTSGICGDLEALPFADASFSLAWSNLALQWCQPDRAYPEFHRVLKPGATLVFSTLLPGTLQEFEIAFDRLDDYPHVLPFSTRQATLAALDGAGFKKVQYSLQRWVSYHRDFKMLLASIRDIGANRVIASSENGSAHDDARHRRGMMGKTLWQTMQQRYEALRTAEGYLPATYVLLLVRAEK